jgi:DNA-binding response OmpR family regulator
VCLHGSAGDDQLTRDRLGRLAAEHQAGDLLLSRVWGQVSGVETNVVDVYVAYLRKKLEAPGEPKLIHTVRGGGYALRWE